MRFQLPAAVAILASVAGARAEDLALALAATDGGFEPAQLEAPTDGRIRLEVSNRTAVAIEFESFDLNRERVIQPGQQVTVYLSGLPAGRYEFFDDFHQERRGALLVK